MTRTASLVLSLAGVLLASGGCTGVEESSHTKPVTRSSTGAPSPTATPAEAELIQALERSQSVAYRYTVQGDLPDDEKIKSTGAVDPVAQVFKSTVEVTGPKGRSALQRIVVGADSYTRPVGDKIWIHLDLKRAKPNIFMRFDMADPTGLVTFTSAINSVRRTGPHTYQGSFDPNQKSSFLPVGAPCLISFGMRPTPFTITTDDQGWVTSITVELASQKSPTLTLKTTMSGHGKPLQIKAPSKSSTHEADNAYYDS